MEQWKHIKDYPRYEISNIGRVRTFLDGKNLILKQHNHNKGYKRVALSIGNDQYKKHYVHCLVLEAFVSEKPANYQCNHKNGIKSDNRVENLEWVTGIENMHHAIANGLWNPQCGRHPGESNSHAKLKESDVIKIRELGEFLSRQEIAQRYNVHPTTIRDILNRKRWAHIPPSTDSRKAVTL